jgi:hypothetical protein
MYHINISLDYSFHLSKVSSSLYTKGLQKRDNVEVHHKTFMRISVYVTCELNLSSILFSVQTTSFIFLKYNCFDKASKEMVH